jgi:hypothetical protein
MNQTGFSTASYASVGGIVGGIGGAIVLAGAFAFFYRMRQRRAPAVQVSQTVQPPNNFEEPQMTQLYDEA